MGKRGKSGNSHCKESTCEMAKNYQNANTQMASIQESLQCIFSRPLEPIFMPKGQTNPIVFNVPDQFLNDRLKLLQNQIKTRFASKDNRSVQVQNISLPDLSIAEKLDINDGFSLFIPSHEEMAANLIDVFMKPKSVQDLLSIAAYAHEKVNPYLFNYALSVALLHRKDTRDIVPPNFLEIFPAKFVNSTTLSQVKQESVLVPRESREPIVIAQEYTANSREPEQQLAYFREDIGINLHHWHWHLVYPTRSTDMTIVSKDRRGELFYYMHQQFVARYNIERFAHNMLRIKNLDDFREVIPEGYFPKLQRQVASRAWAPRFANTKLSDVDRPNDRISLKISDMETWQKNILAAIAKGSVQDAQGKQIPLTENGGIDILGNVMEASILSPNRTLYGNLHNMGHVLLSMCHDPDGRFLESFSTIGDTATSMRDPVFYRWHSKINDIFLTYKDKLPKYPVDQLEYKNVSITDIQLVTEGKTPNEFHTFWQQSDVDLSRGIDFVPSGPATVRFTHLQHEPFSYVVKVKNASSTQIFGTMRIFLAPKVDDKKSPMSFDVVRKLMIELDKFKVTLKPGENTITRKSLDSSVTIPYERTFRNVDANRPTDIKQLDTFNFCGCGWPQHMLIPKGNEKGFPSDLFIMVSNYDGDKIEQDVTGICNDADSFCGIQDKLYPDKRSMGYPFDRMGRPGCNKLSDFLTPNMKVKDVIVKFENRTVVKSNTAQPQVVASSIKK